MSHAGPTRPAERTPPVGNRQGRALTLMARARAFLISVAGSSMGAHPQLVDDVASTGAQPAWHP